ncbi:MAG TPA: RNA polymerase sigma factor [Candidatus Marinimicrobia bacterium]|nr:RNA polymerase sigma factor [Candidatus Neomarinimicrobiota bacterium]
MKVIDESTIELAKTGDNNSLSEIVNAYSPNIYSLSLKFMRNKHDAEDVLQETFLKMLNSIPKFEGRSTLYSWLYRIATNTALEKLRKKYPEQFEIELDTVDYHEHSGRKSFELPYFDEKDLDNSDLKIELNSAIKKLNAKLRIVFILRDIEGNSVKETAKILNLSEANVKVRLMRARMFLKENLEDYYKQRNDNAA